MKAELDMSIHNDVLTSEIHILRLDIDDRYKARELPVRTKFSSYDNIQYREFLASFEATLEHLRNWLNESTLKPGIVFPYTMEEFDTEIMFEPGQMIIAIEVEKEAQEYWEEQYWDDDYKEQHNIPTDDY